MEQTGSEGTSKDEAMKKTFESSFEATEKKDSKKKKKSLADSFGEPAPSEKSEKSEKPVKLEKAEKTEKPEKAPEEVEATETVEIADGYVEANMADAVQELNQTTPSTAEEAAAAASVAFIEALDEKLDSVEEVTDDVLDEVVAETLDSLDIEAEDEPDEPDEIEPDAEVVTGDVEDGEDDEDLSSPPPRRPGSAGTPPTPPTPPSPPTPPTPPPVGGGPGAAALPPPPGVNPNVMVAPTSNPNLIDAGDAEFRRRRQRSGDLLLGGIIGYMIGRRRGRIKTENRLLPIQQNLEKQVNQLQEAIAAKEAVVRSQAVREFQQAGGPSEKMTKKVAEIRRTPEAPAVAKVDQEPKSTVEFITQTETKETTVEVQTATGEKTVTRKTVESISLPLLLQMAAEIKLNGSSLRGMYEKGGVDQKNLRIIMKKYLEGQPLEKIWPKALEREQANRGNENYDERGLEVQSTKDNQGAGDGGGAAQANQPQGRPFGTNLPPLTPPRPLSTNVEDILRPKATSHQNPMVWPVIIVIAAIVMVLFLIAIFG